MTDNPTTAPPKLEPFKPPFEVFSQIYSGQEEHQVIDATGSSVSPRFSDRSKADWLCARLSQPSAPGVDAEYVLVPREPTLEMCGAAGTAVPDNECMPNVKGIYRAMLSAAPKHTSGPHSPAPGLTEEERRHISLAVERVKNGLGGWSEHHLLAIISRLTAAESKAHKEGTNS